MSIKVIWWVTAFWVALGWALYLVVALPIVEAATALARLQ